MVRRSLLVAAVVGLVGVSVGAAQDKPVFRIGMIGLDTSHVVAFTELLNNPANNYGCKVVAGYPGGSDDLGPGHKEPVLDRPAPAEIVPTDLVGTP